VLFWFDAPKEAPVDFGKLPVWGIRLAKENAFLYGFPRLEKDYAPGANGFKAAMHYVGDSVDPDGIYDKIANQKDIDFITPPMEKFLSGALGPINETKTCLYENSMDMHFHIGLHPRSNRVAVFAGGSGHGFKF
jgi:N-methyl-L-tryptophan oxidase